MELHWLPIFFSLNMMMLMMMMTAHEALPPPPEIYWKMMLPTTPMPKAVIELLRGGVSTRKSIETETQLKDGGAKEIPPQEMQLLFYVAKDTQSEAQLRSVNLGAKEIPAQETQSKSKLHISNLGAKEIPPQETQLLFYAAKDTQSEAQLRSVNLGAKKNAAQENNQILFYAAKETRSRNELSIPDLGAKVITPQEMQLLFYAAKDTQSEGELRSVNLGTKENAAQENQLVFHAAKETRTRNELSTLGLGAKEITPQETQLIFYAAKDTQSESELRSVNHMPHEMSSRVHFFQEDQLHQGNKFYVHLNKIKSAVPLLPRQIAQDIPFSTHKMKQVLEMLSLKPNSLNAKTMEKTIAHCETPPMDGEEKHCATSLESMVDFVTSKLGSNVRAMSTEVGKETRPQNLQVKDGIEKLGDDEHIVACHPMTYPYVVFWCHKVEKTSAYFVPLEGEEDGVRVKAVAVCHRDTSKWDPNYVAFQMLNVSPGTVPVCHFFPEGHLIWLPK